MAVDLVFPFFDILVNRIFGSVGLSLVAIAGVIALILGLCRSSWVFIVYWIMFYAITVITFYAGALGVVIGMAIGGVFIATQIVRLFSPDR